MSQEDPSRVLVVDDDAAARMLMRAALRKAGFEVTTAEGGEAALKCFAAGSFDLVLLDEDMPDLSGHEVCSRMRADGGRLLPIVMVTGMDDVNSVERAFDSGATDFIGKPINWALLGHRVRYLLRSYRTLLDLRSAEARHAAVLQALPDLLFEVDRGGRYLDCHSTRAEFLLQPVETLIGRTIAEVMPPEAARVCEAAIEAAERDGRSSGLQVELPLAEGPFWFELSVSRKSLQPGEEPRFILLLRDITERREAEQRIRRLAFFDGLTGLPNREAFLDRLQREIDRSARGDLQLGVLFMDMDGFKSVNDTLGHAAGDKVLRMAADRLRQSVRPSDLVSRACENDAQVKLARLGGDEFTALILDLSSPEDALTVARRIGALMRQPFEVDGRQLTLPASIGIALYPSDGTDALTLLKHADTAMYHAKESGRDNCQFYSAELTRSAVQRMEIDWLLRGAIEREEFSLVYQPQIDLASGRIDSVEALIRWNHPVRGPIPPLDFIPVAETNGQILPIGRWVLQTACREAAAWQRAGLEIRVAVNLSPVQFRDPQLMQTVADVLAETGLAPRQLELEVTEGTVMRNTTATLATLNALRAHGVHLALDDFGTGYSSLSYLKRMPLSNLKVDRSFVSGLPGDRENSAIVHAILAMARSLGIRVTAEGVETIEQARTLEAMACESLQGYFFSRPVAAPEILALIDRRWSLD